MMKIRKNFGFMTVLFCCVSLIFGPPVSLSDEIAPMPISPQGDIETSAEKISLDYKDAELSSVLRALAYSYGLNLVPVKDIKGKVTMTLQDVTVDEALGAILSVNGYMFTRKGNLIYITTGPGVEGIDVVTVTLPLEYLVASEASALLQKIVSSRGDIRVNEATNSLLVTDYPVNIDRVKKALKEIDTPPIQVLIEAKLVDITEKTFDNYGTTYTYDARLPMGGIGFAGSQNMSGPSGNIAGGQFKITTFTSNYVSGSLTIDALIQKNKAHVLASPSITTLNGKEARIIIGERYPYFEKTQTTTGTIQSTKFADIGTTLRVTPRVSPDGLITMYVHPEVSSFVAALEAGPRIATREADATVRVRDGETFAIGGLIRREDSNTRGKMPILGNIPILGMLFSKASDDLSSTELVVFITPRVIRMPEDVKAPSLSRHEEVTVSIDGIGERAMVNKLWEEAQELEDNKGVISRAKDELTRMSDALDHYKQIASQFPGDEKAPEALYRAGLIAYEHFLDMELSKKLFVSLIEKYPDSRHRDKARKMIGKIDKKTIRP